MELTKTEKNILKAVGECGQSTLTVQAIAEKAGCSPAFVCEKLKNQEFKGMFKEMLESSLSAETPQILQTMATNAKKGAFKEAKLLLELTGIYNEKQRMELSGRVDVGVDIFKDEEEKNSFIRSTLKRFAESGDEEC